MKLTRNKTTKNNSLSNSKIMVSIKKFLKTVLKPVIWLGNKIVPKYFKNSFKELKLVTWPNRKESRQLTSAVIVFAVVLSLIVALIDLGLDKVFKKVILKQ
jgi:preprotein translocase SecE subunit